MGDETTALVPASPAVEGEVLDASLWVVNETRTQDHWLEVEDPEGWYTAVANWDGCVHFYRYFNQPFNEPRSDADDEPCYLHICDIDETIARLQALKALATAHFNRRGSSDDWPREPH